MILNGETELRILFIGCVESSEIFLKALLEHDADIIGVITKKQSKGNADFVDLSEICLENNIRYLYVDTVNEVKAKEFIQELKPDVGFCFGWSQLLKKDVLDMFSKGVIGFHPAALPQNKGRHPIIWALALGLSETASSFFILDEGADTGKIISQIKVPILYSDTARTLYDKIMDVAQKQVVDLWLQICEGTYGFHMDGGQEGNTWRKRTKNDGKIDWRMSGRSIYNLVRALSEPYAGAHFLYHGEEYKIWETRELPDSGYENIEPGKIIDVTKDNQFFVKTGSGIIEVIRYDNDFKPDVGMYL